MVTTHRRLVRDRIRYNAIRRIALHIEHVIRRNFPDAAKRIPPQYDIARELSIRFRLGSLRFRGWQRCPCGRKRQPIRMY